jgi:predicted small secreted protein
MNQFDFKVNTKDIASWFNALRLIKDDKALRKTLDAFYYGQLVSKSWICSELENYIDKNTSIYIFGGWIGILANLLMQQYPYVQKVYNVDIDPCCKILSDTVNHFHISKFVSETYNMINYIIPNSSDNKIIINTITEHLNQNDYDVWLNNLPVGSIVLIQGNNLYDMEDHVRCSSSLSEFMLQNRVRNELYKGEVEFQNYKRFMTIWRT